MAQNTRKVTSFLLTNIFYLFSASDGYFITDPLAHIFVLLKNIKTFSIKIFNLGIKVVLNCYILYGIFGFTFYKEDLECEKSEGCQDKVKWVSCSLNLCNCLIKSSNGELNFIHFWNNNNKRKRLHCSCSVCISDCNICMYCVFTSNWPNLMPHLGNTAEKPGGNKNFMNEKKLDLKQIEWRESVHL